MSDRVIKVNSLIKEEIGKLILCDFSFPLGVFVTVVDAKVSKDLRYADVVLSIFPADRKEEVLDSLDECIYDLQQKINKKLSMKPVPKIRFEVDSSGEYVQKIEALIRKAKERDCEL